MRASEYDVDTSAWKASASEPHTPRPALTANCRHSRCRTCTTARVGATRPCQFALHTAAADVDMAAASASSVACSPTKALNTV
jgi:hypothetical protein